ncbi:hypothetical protein VCRA2110O2_30237 [Vibrio crassostreae]|nr:hypothetical protein VCRA2110O2_30237 [Vibrio crassostreae]
MFGFVAQPPADEEKVVNVRISKCCTKVKEVATAEVFDPKGDSALSSKLYFTACGQLPYGEWLKKLTANDQPPLGNCGKYFSKNSDLISPMPTGRTVHFGKMLAQLASGGE